MPSEQFDVEGLRTHGDMMKLAFPNHGKIADAIYDAADHIEALENRVGELEEQVEKLTPFNSEPWLEDV